MRTLRRTRVGPFAVEQAMSLETDRDDVRAGLLPAGLAVADLPRLVLAERERERLRNGLAVSLPGAAAREGEEVAVFDEAGTLTAVCEVDARPPAPAGEGVCVTPLTPGPLSFSRDAKRSASSQTLRFASRLNGRIS